MRNLPRVFYPLRHVAQSHNTPRPVVAARAAVVRARHAGAVAPARRGRRAVVRSARSGRVHSGLASPPHAVRPPAKPSPTRFALNTSRPTTATSLGARAAPRNAPRPKKTRQQLRRRRSASARQRRRVGMGRACHRQGGHRRTRRGRRRAPNSTQFGARACFYCSGLCLTCISYRNTIQT